MEGSVAEVAVVGVVGFAGVVERSVVVVGQMPFEHLMLGEACVDFCLDEVAEASVGHAESTRLVVAAQVPDLDGTAEALVRALQLPIVSVAEAEAEEYHC